MYKPIQLLRRQLDTYFHVTERGSTIKLECLAGLSVYLSLAHTFITNPAILSNAGINPQAGLFATAIASGATTLLMGLWARMPFALAPGAEMNSFFAFIVVGVLGLTWQQGLGVAFWSGILCVVLTALPVRQKIMAAMPDTLKASISTAVGVFVAMTGLRLAEVVTFVAGVPRGLGPLSGAKAIVLYVGLVLSLLLSWRRKGSEQPVFVGGKLVAIIIAAILCRVLGIVGAAPPQVSMNEGMLSAALELDLLVLFQPTVAVFSAFLVLFLIDFYGSLAKFVGLSRGTQLVDKPSDLGRAMYVDGIGTSVGAVCGTSNIITFVQSLVGIGMGARTGITACVCAGLMFASLGLLPLVGLVPVVAAAGVLIHVGWNLVPIREIRGAGWSRGDITALLLMVVTVASMYSLDKALLVGFAFYVGQQVFSKERRVDWYLVGSTLLLAVSVGLQLFIRGR